MGSEIAAAVAHEVIDTVRKGMKPHKQKIQIKHGYSLESARSMKALQTKSYEKVVKPIVDQLDKERQRAIKAMSIKDLDEVAYEKLSDVIDKLTKNIELLRGNPTERKQEVYDDKQYELIKERIRKVG